MTTEELIELIQHQDLSVQELVNILISIDIFSVKLSQIIGVYCHKYSDNHEDFKRISNLIEETYRQTKARNIKSE